MKVNELKIKLKKEDMNLVAILTIMSSGGLSCHPSFLEHKPSGADYLKFYKFKFAS